MFSCLSSARNDVRRVRELHFIFKTRLLSRNARNEEIHIRQGRTFLPGRRLLLRPASESISGRAFWQAMTQVTYMGLFNNKLSGTLPTTLLFLQELLFITFKTN
jgi:hypothetical protein